MGRKGSWFSAVKKALTPESKEKKDERNVSSNSGCDDNDNDNEDNRSNSPESNEEDLVFPETTTSTIEDDVKLTQDQNDISHQLTTARFPKKPKEETAAIKIQNVFRGYRARKALKRLRGLVRLKILVESKSMKRQAMTTLKCMQTLAHVQSEVQMRRIRMTAENLALQKDIPPKNEKTSTLPKPKALAVTLSSEEWINSPRSKEQLEAKMQNKQDAAIRRERALAYSYSHQQKWRNPSKKGTPTILDQKNPHWGWNWLERWVTDQSWETKCDPNKDGGHATSRQVASFPKPNNPNRQQSSNSISKPPSRAKKQEDSSRNQSNVHQRRHSLPGFPTIDDHDRSSHIPNHMASPNRKTRSRGPSPLGNVIPENKSILNSKTKKSMSFPSSSSAHNRNSIYENTKTTHSKNGNVQ
ncbi:protein IQ-DOMAIN 2-like [Impatiens glandulifera]|uniref:protein IQ-DOMAIN 2-like n=1 Tax=Impatiens glandulifera TaxID=253017 RepID=UPI001FB131A3|nr:protein IQ-DOMAIN 2-like [Impatiens glandulifera]